MKRLFISLSIILLSLSLSAQGKETKIKIFTDMGKVTVKLYNETPQHRDNFVKLVQDKYYENVLFHRVVKLFMAQAGEKAAPKDTTKVNPKNETLDYTIPAEILFPQFFHKRGQLCMARKSDEVNPTRASSGVQFYIVTGKFYTDSELNKLEMERRIEFTPEQREAYKMKGGAPHLDSYYTVFGEVTKGMRTIEKIELVETQENDRPVKDVRIKKMKILKK